jgi:hypothetical protein
MAVSYIKSLSVSFIPFRCQNFQGTAFGASRANKRLRSRIGGVSLTRREPKRLRMLHDAPPDLLNTLRPLPRAVTLSHIFSPPL